MYNITWILSRALFRRLWAFRIREVQRCPKVRLTVDQPSSEWGVRSSCRRCSWRSRDWTSSRTPSPTGRTTRACFAPAGTEASWRKRHCKVDLYQPENTHFVRGSITIRLTSCLTGLDLAKQVNLLTVLIKQNGWILTSHTGGQPYSYQLIWSFAVQISSEDLNQI